MARAGRGREPQTDVDAARVLELLAHLEEREIAVWLDGGWAIDALLGEQTRAHDDLDLVSRLADSIRIAEALAERGYVHAGGELPHSVEFVDPDGRQVDAHPVAFAANGDGVYEMWGGGEWIFPAAGFGGNGVILGCSVPCLTPEVVMVNHSTGYALDEEHQRDVIALGERYGIPVPEFERLS